jgi:hypothetical protein
MTSKQKIIRAKVDLFDKQLGGVLLVTVARNSVSIGTNSLHFSRSGHSNDNH